MSTLDQESWLLTRGRHAASVAQWSSSSEQQAYTPYGHSSCSSLLKTTNSCLAFMLKVAIFCGVAIILMATGQQQQLRDCTIKTNCRTQRTHCSTALHCDIAMVPGSSAAINLTHSRMQITAAGVHCLAPAQSNSFHPGRQACSVATSIKVRQWDLQPRAAAVC